MPATFPSHAAAVVPLWLWRPRWFDLTALVIGSTTPDLAYVVVGLDRILRTHQPAALLWWCVPVGVVATLLTRWSVAGAAAHLPGLGPLALRDYGVLGRVRPPWLVTVGSVLIGAVSHQFWDRFSHAYTPFAVAHRIGPLGEPWWQWVQWSSTVLGALAVLGMLVHVGRRRLLVRVYGEAPAEAVRPRLFWTVTATVLVPGVAATLPWLWDPTGTIVRWMVLLALAPMAGAAAVRLAGPRSDPDHTVRTGERARL
ncbi:MAG: hypothetical protein JWM15_661 [Cryptosporangiaceae bacterium]|nr:hypothetical protein [Cryptosporangiaceae bacterium]